MCYNKDRKREEILKCTIGKRNWKKKTKDRRKDGMAKSSLLADSGATTQMVQEQQTPTPTAKYGMLYEITEKAESGIDPALGSLLPKILIHTALWIKTFRKIK